MFFCVALYRDKSGDKTLYLTFDNGYENGHTKEILYTLKQEDIKGPFFLTGHYLSSAPDYVKRMAAEGVYSKNTLRIANKLGYQHIFWSMAIVDWHVARRRGTDVVVKELLDQLHPGAIILLHTVTQDNAEALHYSFKKLKSEDITLGN